MSHFLATVCVNIADLLINTVIIASGCEHPHFIIRVFEFHNGEKVEISHNGEKA